MTLKPNKPIRKFGGTAADGRRNQREREHQNQVHDLNKQIETLGTRVEQLQLELRCFDQVPVKALGKVMKIPTRDAIQLEIVDPIRDIHRWVESYALARFATGKDVPSV